MMQTAEFCPILVSGESMVDLLVVAEQAVLSVSLVRYHGTLPCNALVPSRVPLKSSCTAFIHILADAALLPLVVYSNMLVPAERIVHCMLSS